MISGNSPEQHMKGARAKPSPDGGRFFLGQVDVPQPGKGEILIRVKSSALNRGEVAALQRMTRGAEAANLGGLECSGIVGKIGEEVSRWQVGDHVIARTLGCFAEYVCAVEDEVIPKPATLNWDEAACLPNAYVTAHDAIAQGAHLVPGETLLVTAGTSGVGIAAIQVGLALGASVVYATTRSYDKADVLKRLGATPIVVGTEASDYPAALEKASQHKVDVVVDLVGGAVAQYLLNVLSPYGRFVSVGRSDFSHASIDLDEVARKNLIILGRSYRTRTPQQTIECITSFEEQLGPALIKGTLKPIVDRCFPLYKIEEAISYMRLNRHIGKIAITVG